MDGVWSAKSIEAHSAIITDRARATVLLQFSIWLVLMTVSVLSLPNMGRVMRKPILGVSDQVRHKSGCTATEDC